MADIELLIKIPEKVHKSIINGKNYISYQEYVEDAIKNGTPLPGNATNGEVILALFPDDDWEYDSFYNVNWWNAPYKMESETSE